MSTKKGTKRKASETRYVSLSEQIERLRGDAQALAEVIVMQEVTRERLRVIRLANGLAEKHIHMIGEADAAAEG